MSAQRSSDTKCCSSWAMWLDEILLDWVQHSQKEFHFLILGLLQVAKNKRTPYSSRLSEVRSWPSWTWVQTGPTPWVRVSGPVRSGPAPDFVGPGPGGEWTGPWSQTGVGPGPNLYFQFIILCTVSNIILSFCNHFQEGRSLKLFMHHRNESTTPVAGLSSLSLPCTTHFRKFLFHLFLCN